MVYLVTLSSVDFGEYATYGGNIMSNISDQDGVHNSSECVLKRKTPKIERLFEWQYVALVVMAESG
jgi:hypothetical protein